MDKNYMNKFWHSSAHVLAYAVKNLFPNVKVAIGPAIENGFYYDFDNLEIKDEDLKRIEDEMKKIIKQKYFFTKKIISKEDALNIFESEPYKIELIKSIPFDEEISIYELNEFKDLCAGPHLEDISNIKAIKLLNIAGAYWKGNSNNKMLTRIYGISFPEKSQLKEHLEMLEEAKKRDHRLLGKTLDLFSMHPEAPGSVFWHHNGWILFNNVINYWRKAHRKYGFLEINTPQVMDKSLWEKSGHWQLYKENMFISKLHDKEYALKPMSCPGNILYYKENVHSYKEFPLRIAELGLVHRNELSGVLHGLMRVRQITQDDAHIYVTEELLENEIINIINMAFELFRKFGFENFDIEVGVRSEAKKDKYLGDDEGWNKAENALKNALEKMSLNYSVEEGEAKFYGPCIDIMIKDSLKRKWQCSTIQLDFNLPKRFDLEYVDKNGEKKVPIMLHRTLLGSLERFLGILIEHHAGVFPEWLSPIQVSIIPVNENHIEYSKKIFEFLEDNNIRAVLVSPVESLSKRLRNSIVQKIPYSFILGDEEVNENIISFRKYGDVKTEKIKLCDFKVKSLKV